MTCPWCHWTETTHVPNGDFVQVACCRCGARGPNGTDNSHATEEWDRRNGKRPKSSLTAKERVELLPTKEPSKKIAKLFRRNTDTPWSHEEKNAYLQINKKAIVDLDLVIEFYTTSKHDYLRTSLLTFCRHFQGEADKARSWVAAGKPIPYQNGQTRSNAPVNPRVAGSANEGLASQYAGSSRVKRVGSNGAH